MASKRGAGKPPIKARGKAGRPVPGPPIVPQPTRPLDGLSDAEIVLTNAQRIANIAIDKLGEDVVILDMREFCTFTDYFVIASGRNTRQVKGMFDEILEKLKQESRWIARAVAGEREADWIVIDFIDVVVHLLTPEQREFYRLEELWGDVPRVEIELEPDESPAGIAADDDAAAADT